MNRAVTYLTAVVLAWGCVTEVSAEGWQLPNLNPFSTPAPVKPSPYRIKDAPAKSWLPALPKPSFPKPSFPKPSFPKTNGPSLMQRAQSAPGNMARGTMNAVNAVNPFKAAPSAPPPTTQYSNESKKKPAPSWYSPWGDTTEPKGAPQTASDFIGGARPE